jgi:hypothetical protein
MSSRHLRAIVMGLAIVAAPVGQAAVWAQAPSAPTVVSLQATISSAARAAASAPSFRTAAPEAKLATIQGAVAQGLSTSGATPQLMAQALVAAVKAGTISAGVAIAVAASVAPEFAQMVANDPVVLAQLAATGQSATVTGALDGGPSVNVLVNLQGAPGGGATPAAFDPCAGVVAAYCGG